MESLNIIKKHSTLSQMESVKRSNMNFYLKSLQRIKAECFSNRRQLEIVINTRNFINTNFDKELNLDYLSNKRFTSKFHLIRLFKKYYGVTPKQYMIDKRIEYAKIIIVEGVPISTACYEVGFQTPSSFSTLFKSRVGLSPSEFQKRAIFAKS